jgi:transposase-like protein
MKELGGDAKIGGINVVVQIDESKFGKRKYHRGHRVNGHWVVGGIEMTEEKNVFAVVVPDRKIQTLVEVIVDNVAEGSIIYTDCWSGYSDAELTNIGFTHDTVNHTYHFVDPITGLCINSIEATWSKMKPNCPISL